MNILTETDFARIHRESTGAARFSETDLIAYRAIEAAVLSKLAEQDMEPVAFAFKHSLLGILYDFSETEHSNGMVRLYTEAQLITARQHTAEACANLGEEFMTSEGLCDAILSGEWRKCL